VSAWSARLRVALAVPALVAIFLLGQGILDARGWRLDLTPERRYTLSDHARKVVAGLPADVRVLAFLRSQDPRNLLFRDVLRQARRVGPRLRVEELDVNRNPALARQYGVDSYGALVVESEGRRRIISNPREEVLVGALLQVTRQQRKTIGWVRGHGEGEITDTDRKLGYSTARALLEQEYYDVRPISLMADEVPVEVAVLVIAGPEKDFLPEELGALERYLQRPGQVLVMLDPLRAPELVGLLRRYDVDLPPDVVVDPAARLYGGELVTMQVQFERNDHPIVAPLDAPPLFSRTRSVGKLPGEGRSGAAVSFLRTSSESWATTDTGVLRTGRATFISERDQQGPVSVGMEFAFRVLASPGEEPRQGRLVVYGNSDFANNFFIQFLGNTDLFVNSVNWLAHEPDAISNRPHRQELGLHQFYVSAEEGDRAFWLTAVVEPVLFLLVGVALVVRRRWA
jgi:ABC-type uncharacterized transport system involved in gliding motility auxiliary subunit